MSVEPKITKELEAAEKKYKSLQPETFLAKDGKTLLAKLTFENVAKIEALIRIDSRYHQDDSDQYFPYWIKELGKHLGYLDGEIKVNDFPTVVENAVNKIDSENSTRLNVDGGREWMMTKIKALADRGVILDYLKKPEHKIELIKILSTRTKKGGDRHLSFASKFCHYACFYIFKGENAQDNFSPYDNVVVNILPKYLAYYEIADEKSARKDLNKNCYSKCEDYSELYKKYSEYIDNVIDFIGKSTGEYISRNGFDHLLWYYFKSNPKTSDK